MTRADDPKPEWLEWLPQAVEIVAIGAGVFLILSLRRMSRSLSAGERLVLWGCVAAGFLALQRGVRAFV